LQIILPPTRTIALVEFAESADAKKAFKNLAYTQFRNVPLYLGMSWLGAAQRT
jgi:multiple RNA-binding domain-containing protein 1